MDAPLVAAMGQLEHQLVEDMRIGHDPPDVHLGVLERIGGGRDRGGAADRLTRHSCRVAVESQIACVNQRRSKRLQSRGRRLNGPFAFAETPVLDDIRQRSARVAAAIEEALVDLGGIPLERGHRLPPRVVGDGETTPIRNGVATASDAGRNDKTRHINHPARPSCER